MTNENTQPVETTQGSEGGNTPPANQQPPAGQGAATGTAGIPWLNNASAEEVAFAQSKGWDKEAVAPTDQIFRSYHNLQKLFGADKAGNTVVIPGENADQATLDTFYNRLGRPEKPDGYVEKVKAFSGLNDEQYKGLRETAHALGLTAKQLEGLSKWNDELGASIQKQLETDAQMEFARQESALKQEWGAAYDQNLQAGRVAVSQLGISKEEVDALQVSLGFDGVMKLMAKIGGSLGEGSFVTGDKGRAGGAQSNVMTPEQAKGELDRLMNDKEFKEAWMDKMHPRHKEMIDRKSQLSKWAAGEK